MISRNTTLKFIFRTYDISVIQLNDEVNQCDKHYVIYVECGTCKFNGIVRHKVCKHTLLFKYDFKVCTILLNF